MQNAKCKMQNEEPYYISPNSEFRNPNLLHCSEIRNPNLLCFLIRERAKHYTMPTAGPTIIHYSLFFIHYSLKSQFEKGHPLAPLRSI